MHGLVLSFALLLGSAVVIYLSCEYFVNGVEWLGRRLSMGAQATGTVLSAFGTALPESVVTLVAVAFGATAASKELGVGAALGGPLALSTIAYATVGIVLLITHQQFPKGLAANGRFERLANDQRWFLILFALKIGLGLILFAGKPWTGLIFLIAYGLYVRAQMRHAADPEEEEELEPLKLTPKTEKPSLLAAAIQTGIALVVIFFASRLFVGQLEHLGPALGLRPQLLALLLSPIATELPETMNAIIWVRQGKYALALANISGAMMIQATIPTALGLFFTPWRLGAPLILAAAVTAVAVVVMFCAFRRNIASRKLLAARGGLYAVFASLLVALHLS